MNAPVHTPVDEGYSWVILAASFFSYLLTVGHLKTFGILYAEFLEYFHTSAASTAWVSSLMLALTLGLGPIVNYMCVRFSFKMVTIFGGFMLFVSFVTTSFVPQMEYMYLTMGVFSGLGCACSFPPCAAIVNFYFEKRRALANGIVVAASGVGAFIIPYVYLATIEAYGLRGSILISGAIYLNVWVGAMFFIQPVVGGVSRAKSRKRKESKRSRESADTKGLIADDKHSNGNNTSKNTEHANTPTVENRENNPIGVENSTGVEETTTSAPKLNFDMTIIFNPVYQILVVSIFFAASAYGTTYFLIAAHIEHIGLGRKNASLVISVMGITELFSRIFVGWFTDLRVLPPKYTYLISMFCSGVVIFFVPLMTDVISLCIFSVIFGIFGGSFFAFIPLILVDTFGIRNFPGAFGVTTCFMAVAAFISLPFAGWLKDNTGDWNASIYMIAVCFVISSIIVLFEPFVARVSKRRQEAKRQQEEEHAWLNTSNPIFRMNSQGDMELEILLEKEDIR